MKRKLIKRNKQFLSSRYTPSLEGNGSFQRLTSSICYYNDKTDSFTFKQRRYTWMWFYKADWIESVFKNIDSEVDTDCLNEMSFVDQELRSY